MSDLLSGGAWNAAALVAAGVLLAMQAAVFGALAFVASLAVGCLDDPRAAGEAEQGAAQILELAAREPATRELIVSVSADGLVPDKGGLWWRYVAWAPYAALLAVAFAGVAETWAAFVISGSAVASAALVFASVRRVARCKRAIAALANRCWRLHWDTTGRAP